MIGYFAGLTLVVLLAVLIPLRFARALRSSLTDPEFRGLLGLVVLTLATGTVFYAEVEGWSVMNGFYFCAITLTTVGYGELAPSTVAGKLFTVFYIFASIGIILAFVDTVARASVEQGQVIRERQRRRSEASEGEHH